MGSPPGANTTQPNVPITHANVLVETLLVNATKHGGRCWDPGCDEKESGQASRAAADAAAAAMVATTSVTMVTATPFAVAFGILAPMAMGVTSNPDAHGWAYTYVNGQRVGPAKLVVRRDTLTPQWGLVFNRIPITDGTALRLELYDSDPDIPLTNGDDDMGIITIPVLELEKAMKENKTYQVYVGDQTYDQVLFVGISVVPIPQ